MFRSQYFVSYILEINESLNFNIIWGITLAVQRRRPILHSEPTALSLIACKTNRATVEKNVTAGTQEVILPYVEVAVRNFKKQSCRTQVFAWRAPWWVHRRPSWSSWAARTSSTMAASRKGFSTSRRAGSVDVRDHLGSTPEAKATGKFSWNFMDSEML